MFAYTFKQQFIGAALLFIAAGTAALWLDELWLIIIPFVWILLKPVISIISYKTEYIYYTIFALLPLSTEITFTSGLSIDFPDELLMMAITAIFFILVIHKPSIIPKVFYHHPLIFLLVLHLAWLAIACFYSMDVLLSAKFLVAKTWYIIPFTILPSIFFTTKTSLKKLALLLIIPMAFVVVQSLLRHSAHNFSFEGIKETLSPFFRNHVTYSAMLVCLMVVCWEMYILTPKKK
jgi:hypothetical protein